MKSCIFCNKYGHESKDCKEYKTEKDRKKRPNSKRFCFCCFVVSDAAHYPWDQKCGSNDKCDAWNSSYHHTLFCKERLAPGLEASNLFLPQIDQYLLPRFFKILEAKEKYFMIFSSPDAANLVNISKIKIMDTFDGEKFEKCSDSDLVVVNSFLQFYDSNAEKDKKLFDSIRAKTICVPPKIYLFDTTLSSDILLQILSPNTMEFKISDSKVIPKLSFTNMIKKAPNLDTIKVDDSILIEDSWIKDLLKYKTGEKVKSLVVNIDKVEFNIDDMVKLIKKKCYKDVGITVWFAMELLDDDEDGAVFRDFLEELEKYFEYQMGDDDAGSLTVGYEGVDGYETFTLAKIKKPKKAAPLKRTVRKRKLVEE